MIFAKNFARNYEKKNNTWNIRAWSMSHSSQQTSNPEYYIEDCRISSWFAMKWFQYLPKFLTLNIMLYNT